MMTHSKHTTTRSLKRLLTGVWLVAVSLLAATAAPAAPTAPQAKASAHDAGKALYTVITLKKGETAALIAQREQLSMAELARINQDFLPPGMTLEHLMVGQQLRIPSADARINALFIHGDEARTLRQALHATKPQDTTAAAGTSPFGSLAQALGNALNSGDSTDRSAALRSTADDALLSQANNRFNQGMGRALGKLGNARVNLGADRNLDFDGAEISLLHPWVENDQRMLFSQSSVHREDGRTYANLGVGQRHFLASGKMLGYNAFIDQDLTGHNTRASLGVEAWADYLKFGANAYGRLSNWHDSAKLDGYQERPANGFDLQLDGYLPSFPQLGAKLKYEQYFGDKVGLFGNSEDDLQHNPSATTVGLNYTPVPLMTVGVDYSAGQNGKHEASAKVDFNVNLDQPLSTQLNPAKVAARRTVKGSKHDFVERNNKIVLEYRKQDHIALALPALITGKARTTQTVAYSVNAQRGVASVDIQSPALIAAGGQITVGDGQFTLTLPPLLPVNTYTLTGIATSQGGAKSQPAVSTISVVSPVTLRAKLDATELPAAVTESTQLHVTLTDDQTLQPYNLYAHGGQLSFKVVRKNDARLRAGIPHDYTATDVSGVSADANGQVTATVTAGNQPGTDVIEIYADRDQLPTIKVGSATLTLTSLDTRGAQIAMTPGQDHAWADGVATDSLSLVATSSAGVPMINQKVYLSDDQDADAFKDINPLYPDDSGKAEAAFHSLKDGEHTISASFTPGGARAAGTASIRLHFDSSIATTSTLDADPHSVEADGVTTSTLKLEAKNSTGQLLSGLVAANRLGFVVSNGVPGVTIGNAREVTNGHYEATVVGDAQALRKSAVIVPLLDGKPVSGVSTTVNFTNPALSLNDSSFTISKHLLQADGIDAASLTVVALNKARQPVSGLAGSLRAILAPASDRLQVSDFSEVGNSGTYTATLKGTERVDALKVNAQFEGASIPSEQTVKLSLDVDAGNANTTLTASRDKIESDGLDASTLTFKAVNANQQPVTGLGTSLRFAQTSHVGNLLIDNYQEGPIGTYTATLHGTQAGSAVLEPRIDGVAVSGKSVAVVLTPLQVNTANSDLSIDHNHIEADDVDRAMVTFKAVNQHGVPLTGLDAAHLQFVDKQSIAGLTIEPFTEAPAGQYQAVLHGDRDDQARIQPVVNGAAVAKTVDLTLTAMQADAGQSQLTLLPDNIQADGVSKAMLSFTSQNARGKPLQGLGNRLKFVANPASVIIGNITETNGVYRAEISGAQPGSVQLTPQIDHQPVGSLQQTLQLVRLVPDAAHSSFTLSSPALLADGTHTVTATFTAHNENDQPVSLTDMPGLMFGHSGVNGVSVSAVTDQGNGTYSATISGTQPGLAQLAPVINGTAMSALRQSLTLQALQPDAATSSFGASPDQIDADDTARATLTFVAKTSGGQSVVGLGDSLKFVTSQPGVTISNIQEAPAGTYAATLQGNVPGRVTVSAQVNGSAVKTADVQLTPLTMAADQSSFSSDVNQIEADDVSLATLTLIAKNANGHLIGGLSAKLQFALSDSHATVGAIREISTGVYVATLHGLTATHETLTPKLNGSAIGTLSASVELLPLQLDSDQSQFAIAPTFSVDQPDQLTVSLKNANGVGIAGKSISATVGGTHANLSTFTDNHDGSYSASLSDIVPEAIPLQLSVDGKTINYTDHNSSTVVHSLAGAFSETQSKAVVQPTVVAGQETSILLSPRDQYGNALTLAHSTGLVSASIAGGTVTAGAVTDNHNGSYLMIFSTTKAGALQWSWTQDGKTLPASGFAGGSNGHDVTTVLADTIDPNHSTAVVTERLYQDQPATITLHPQDRYGNGVTMSSADLAGTVTGENVGKHYSASNVRDLGNQSYAMSISPSEIGELGWTWLIAGQALPASQYQGPYQNKTAVASRYFKMTVNCDGWYVCQLRYNGKTLVEFAKGGTTEKTIDKVASNIQANPTITFDFGAKAGDNSRDHCTYDSNNLGGTAKMTGTTLYSGLSSSYGPHVSCNTL